MGLVLLQDLGRPLILVGLLDLVLLQDLGRLLTLLDLVGLLNLESLKLLAFQPLLEDQ